MLKRFAKVAEDFSSFFLAMDNFQILPFPETPFDDPVEHCYGLMQVLFYRIR